MTKRETVLISLNLLAEIPADVIDDPDFNDLDKLLAKLDDALENVRSDYDFKLESTQSWVLNMQTMNCGKCATCDCWVSDREKPDVIRQLNIGATVDGRLLCDEHLPKAHRWAF